MPNWCFNTIEFKGKNEDVTKLDNLISKWTSPIRNHENGFGAGWLGNIVINSGLCSDTDDCPYRCRGEITDRYLNDGSLVIHTQTAWVPMIKMWSAVLRKYNLDLEIIYIAEEEGCQLLWTNDPKLVGRYYVYFDLEDYYRDDEYTAEEVIDIGKRYFGIEATDVNDCIAKIESICDEQDICCCIQQWEFVGVDNEFLE